MKLIVQIPCLNEEETLAATLADIPRQVDGIDQVEVLIIDDGSTDNTSQVARQHGADHIVRFAQNRGLGHAFKAGFDTALKLGADIIINTDGDNQYFGGDVATLVQPILEQRADLVIGDRRTGGIGHFSFFKRILQTYGSRVISRLGGLDIPDVASGFRAYTRETALRISMFTDFDHTAEHVVQAGQDRWAVVVVPIRTNPKARESRLFSNIGEFVLKSGSISLRTYARYKGLKIFASCGAAAFTVGFALGLRFLYYFLFTNEGLLHVQSVILSAVLLLAGFQMFLTGIIADLIATNRALMEDSLTRIKKLELGGEDSGA
ncbi:MAG: glycosyltransferase family 2 protein [Gemmatimonadetes bacterium]|jgi:glycosyltransferase involved in cell wall biosynthesis|nr:glycosyltransferase family 2 protein [Gemmatimonadota bacterium]MBT5056618.1 glycosyltransferase family 2 protein [Gemmatimonadota bacterium]MBT5145161.1 glycosyltransferase family 2 protein [Gemmatimonadota bacterium]MBT5586975.1 glycosyltransferase family 2 protein [Gemmatimonadota bacterium]MBT5965362.1 glycosyltransferase family 2 protein [Gemmatimonadota bacterium]